MLKTRYSENLMGVLSCCERIVIQRHAAGGCRCVSASAATRELFVVFMLQSPKYRVHYRSLLRSMIYAAVVKQRRGGAGASDALNCPTP